MLGLLGAILRHLVTLAGRVSGLGRDVERVERAIQRLERKLDRVLVLLTPGRAVKVVFIADLDGRITYGVENMNLGSDQRVGLTIQPVDKKGNPAPVDGVPEWGTSNSELVELDVAGDGLSATATAVGPLGGPVTISVKVDADTGEGVEELIGDLEIVVTGGKAATISIVAGTPTAQE